MTASKRDYMQVLKDGLAREKAGVDPSFIELPDQAVFPHLIPAAPITGRIARSTGTLFGRPGPRFVKRGRNVFYRLSDVYQWLGEGESYSNTAQVAIRSISS